MRRSVWMGPAQAVFVLMGLAALLGEAWIAIPLLLLLIVLVLIENDREPRP